MTRFIWTYSIIKNKKAIFFTKKGKEREFARRMCDSQYWEYLFGQKKEVGDYFPGWGSFLEKHKIVSVVDSQKYRIN